MAKTYFDNLKELDKMEKKLKKIERLICGNGEGMFEDKKGYYVTYKEHKKMIDGLLSELLYSAYSYNRDCGMTHKQLLSIGLGNDSMKLKYEKTN
jgi:hypothetical protein